MTLVEIDAALAALAAENAKVNALDDRVSSIAGNVEDVQTFAGLAAGSIDRVLMNPPFHDVERVNLSPDPRRRLAYAGDKDLLARWVESARHLLKPGGALTLIWRADAADDVMAALKAGFGAVAILRVKARDESPAIRILVRAVKGGRRRDRRSRHPHPLRPGTSADRGRRSRAARRRDAQPRAPLTPPSAPA